MFYFWNNSIWASSNLIWPVWGQAHWSDRTMVLGRAGRPGRSSQTPTRPPCPRARSSSPPGDDHGDPVAVAFAASLRPLPAGLFAEMSSIRRAARRYVASSPSILFSSPPQGWSARPPTARVSPRRAPPRRAVTSPSPRGSWSPPQARAQMPWSRGTTSPTP